MAPNSYRLNQFAQRFLRGRCRCIVLGDSINSQANPNLMPWGYVRQFRPTSWAGLTIHPMGNGSLVGVQSGASLAASVFLEPGNASLAPATKDFWPLTIIQNAFTANISNVYYLPQAAIGATGLGQFADGGAWWLNAGARNVKAIFYDHADAGANPSIPSLRLIPQRNTTGSPGSWVSDGSDVPVVFFLADGYITSTVGLTALADAQSRIFIHDSAPAIDETNQNLITLGVRFYRPDVLGLEMSYAAHGGWDLTDHVDDTIISDLAIETAVAGLELDTIMIWCDANGPATKTLREGVIERWRSAITGAGRTFRCLLIAQYDLGTAATWAAVAEDMYATSQQFTDVSFCNLYAKAGPFGHIYVAGTAATAGGSHPTMLLVGAHSSGATTISFDSADVVGTLQPGDSFVIASNAQRYEVGGSAGVVAVANAFTNVPITPALVANYADNAAVTIGRYINDRVHPSLTGSDQFASLIFQEMLSSMGSRRRRMTRRRLAITGGGGAAKLRRGKRGR